MCLANSLMLAFCMYDVAIISVFSPEVDTEMVMEGETCLGCGRQGPSPFVGHVKGDDDVELESNSRRPQPGDTPPSVLLDFHLSPASRCRDARDKIFRVATRRV